MRTIIAIVFISLLTVQAFPQQCLCEKDLNFLIHYLEENLPAYSVDVTQNKLQYEILKKKLQQEASEKKNAGDCFKTVVRYVEFFKDNHTRIEMASSSIDRTDKKAVDSFIHTPTFASYPIVNLSKVEKLQYSLKMLKGIYRNFDSTYTVAIISRKKGQFQGIILSSQNPLWKPGQVKFELTEISPNHYEGFYNNGVHEMEYLSKIHFDNGILYGMYGWIKTSVSDKHLYANEVSNDFVFHFLDDSTSYIHIPTLDGGKTAFIDSFYLSINDKMRSKPYLIIDLRNNEGGSSRNGTYLWRYFFDKPLPMGTKEYYVGPELIKSWERYDSIIHKDTLNYSKDWRDEIDTLIVKLHSSKMQSFISLKKAGDTATTFGIDTFYNTAKKVILIANRNSASSAEDILYWATFSSKAIIVGENTGGYMEYGEVQGPIFTPNYNFKMFASSARFKELAKYEVNGIPPKYYLDNNSDWIQQAMEILKKESK